VEQGTQRYAAEVPPGYSDAGKKTGDDKFGDYFIWEQMIAEAKSRGLPVIFVTDDRKEDWIQRDGGKDIGPRPELMQEFSERAGQRFYCYPFRAFLEQSRQYVDVKISKEAIKEVDEEAKQARQMEERRARHIRHQFWVEAEKRASNFADQDAATTYWLRSMPSKVDTDSSLSDLLRILRRNRSSEDRGPNPVPSDYAVWTLANQLASDDLEKIAIADRLKKVWSSEGPERVPDPPADIRDAGGGDSEDPQKGDKDSD